MMLWPRMALENRLSGEDYRFLLREKNLDGSIHYGSLQSWLRVTEERRRMMERGFLPQPQQKDFDDLCSLPDLNEKTLLENLRNRFKHEKIYTYVGSILIAINPFKFLPIYNPKYVKMYDNHQLGKLEPHIYAVADVAYHAMLQRKKNQCIVISGESGSGKTQSTNFLIHHLTALSQKGFASGVEQIILGAGPVLEAFGNAKTAHNNNSSRFGKFIQVNYQETGTVLGIFSLLSAILHLGNICYKKKTYRDDSIDIYNPEVLPVVSELLEVKEEMLFEALVTRKTMTVGEKLILPYKLAEAVTVRNSMAKSLYSALFDWIVFRINHALMNSKDLEQNTKTLSIGVLDIFGFEDYENNSFEQFCINFANERLQHYFNQHIFKLEQEEYRSEGISWHNIDYIDNTCCINLISKKPTGLLHLLDEESNFPQATNQTLLDKFKHQHEESPYIEFPAVMEPAFIIKHYAGKVKYGVKDFREKNTDHMRPDIVALLRSSKSAFISGMIGIDPVAIFRWAVLRAFFRAVVAFREAGKRHIQRKTGLARKNPRTPLSDLQGVNTLNEKNQQRNKNFKSKPVLPKHLLEVKSLKHLMRLTLQDRIAKSLLHLHKKKKPPSISAQFQLPLRFSDALVLRQLRYTGMLETVRIRQSGYSCKYSFQVFLKEQGRQHLQDLLHQEVLRRIAVLQRWFRALLCRQHFLQLRQAAVTIQRFWRDYLNQKQVREAAAQKDALAVAHAAAVLQAAWRAHLERQRYLELRAAAALVQHRWRERCRRRHAAAVCIQARWKGYRESKRYKALKEQRLKETKLGLGLANIKPYAALEIQGSDPSEWEDRSFDDRVKAIEECKTVIENNRISQESSGDWVNESPGKRQERARSQSGVDVQEDVIMRERPKSLEDLHQKKVGRAKRESRRMRELEQAIFSLELLKVRSLGGTSPSEERRWSAELVPEGLQSPRGSPDSGSSQGSLELLSCEEGQKSKLEPAILDEGDLPFLSPKRSGSPNSEPQDSALSASDPSNTVLKKLEKLNIEKEERQKQLQQQNEKEMMAQIRQQTGILEKERKAFKTIEKSRTELPGSCRKECKENKEPSPKARRRRSVKISSVALESTHWQNDSVQIIASASDLKSMDEFLLKKMNDLDNEDSKKDTLVDVVFKKALKEFRQNIFSFYSSALAIDDGKSIRYKDLYALFEQILEKTMRLEQRDWSESPVRVWVNTFKVFLDEYMNEFKTLDYIPTKVEEHNGHIFKATQYSIPTYLCKYACHKRCCLKTTAKCSKKYDPELSSRQFGVELSRLTSEDRTVPLVVEKLINYIEMHGLYTEGIYRKSGSNNKIKELRQGLDTDAESVNLDDYNIHVIASVFKQWLRDLPNPLMTFELYEEFLRAMGLQERKETIRGVYSVIDQLSRTHLNTLERLVFHLVRIALQEDTNRMSANALAIVFAPCILRCPDTIDPLQSVQDISKTTTCVELIVVEQMNKYKARLKDINSLEFAENKAKTRLSLIRRSMGKGRLRRGNYPCPPSPVVAGAPSVSAVAEETLTGEAALEAGITEQQQAALQQEERVLTEQIESLQKEKEELTFEMLVLEPRASDDETLESEASIGTADSSENLNVESEGAVPEKSERSLALTSPKAAGKSEPSSRLRKQLKKQQDSLDSVDSSASSLCSSSTASSHGTRKRFQIYSKSPFYRAASAGEALGMEGPLGQTKSLEDRPQFISRGTFNPEKGKQKLKNVKNSPQKTKETPEGTVVSGRRRTVDPDRSSAQQPALFGSNEFMV
ncbi:myosin-IXa [Camelus ferus]|nr:myosin-IXa [Camelus ferus]